MSFSDYLENEVLDHVLNDGTYTPPTIYAGYSTADPGEDATGLAEPTDAAYARVAAAAAVWNAASGGSKSNASTIEFPTATENQGEITHACLFDALTGGNLLMSGALTVAKAIASGSTPRFTAGQFVVTLG
jgi:hypothetical protein